MTVSRKILGKRLPHEIKSIRIGYVATLIPEIGSYLDHFNSDIRPPFA
jgi:hypothetical protein